MIKYMGMGSNNGHWSPKAWPPRFPDLISIHVYFWEYVTDTFYIPPVPVNFKNTKTELIFDEDILLKAYSDF
jgi:hypothetical protein